MGARILTTVLMTVLITFQTLFADSTRDTDRCARKGDDRRIDRASASRHDELAAPPAREDDRHSDCGDGREPSAPPTAIVSR